MPGITPEMLLQSLAARHSAEVLKLGCKLRAIVRRAAPKANEAVYHGALCYGSSVKRNRFKVYITFHTAHVNLGFYNGASLADEKGLLWGEGKQMRHIKVRSVSDVNVAAFRPLIRAALAEERP